jgi:hypothetical protein
MHINQLDTILDNIWCALLKNPAAGLAVNYLKCVIQRANRVSAALFGLAADMSKEHVLLYLISLYALKTNLHNLRRSHVGETRIFVFHDRHSYHQQLFAGMMVALRMDKRIAPEVLSVLRLR